MTGSNAPLALEAAQALGAFRASLATARTALDRAEIDAASDPLNPQPLWLSSGWAQILDDGFRGELRAEAPELGIELDGVLAYPWQAEARLRAMAARQKIIALHQNMPLAALGQALRSPDRTMRRELVRASEAGLRPLIEAWSSFRPAGAKAPIAGIWTPESDAARRPSVDPEVAALLQHLPELIRALAASVMPDGIEDWSDLAAAAASVSLAEFCPSETPPWALPKAPALPWPVPGVPLFRSGARGVAAIASVDAVQGSKGADGLLAELSHQPALWATAATRPFVERHGLRTRPSDVAAAQRALGLSQALAVFIAAASVAGEAAGDDGPGSLFDALELPPNEGVGAQWRFELRLARAFGADGDGYAVGAGALRRLRGGVHQAIALREQFDEDWYRNPQCRPAPDGESSAEAVLSWLRETTGL